MGDGQSSHSGSRLEFQKHLHKCNTKSFKFWHKQTSVFKFWSVLRFD